jgi:hypothetical protein
MGQGQAKEDADDAPTSLVVRLPKEKDGGRRFVDQQILRCAPAFDLSALSPYAQAWRKRYPRPPANIAG